jgi:hypothetical protein
MNSPPTTYRHLSILAALSISLFFPKAYASDLLLAVSKRSTLRPSSAVSTDIYAISITDKQRRIVFSDEKLPILLLPSGTSRMADLMVSAGSRVFARGMERREYPGGFFEGGTTAGRDVPVSIYEVTTDGSNRYRKLFDVRGDQALNSNRRLFASGAGTQVGYVNLVNQKTYVFIHDAPTGNLVQQIDMSPVMLDCFVFNIGFLGDEQTLFFQLDSIGEDSLCDERDVKENYTMRTNGKSAKRFPSSASGTVMQQAVAGFLPEPLGQLENCSYLFKSHKWHPGQSKNTSEVLVLLTADGQTKAEIPLPDQPGGSVSLLKPSGNLVAFTVEKREEKSADVSVMDLTTRKVTRVLSYSLQNGGQVELTVQGLIGWLEPEPDFINSSATTSCGSPSE